MVKVELKKGIVDIRTEHPVRHVLIKTKYGIRHAVEDNIGRLHITMDEKET